MNIKVFKNEEWFEAEAEDIKKDDIFRYGEQEYIYRADEDAYVNKMGTVNFSFSVVSDEGIKAVGINEQTGDGK